MAVHRITKSYKKVFVTVGTTSFDELISCVTSKTLFETFEAFGVEKLTLQIGKGSYQPVVENGGNIKVNYYAFKPSIYEDIVDADLVITHAGAGSVLETLKAKKPVIVVVNSKLMDNHQTELAEALAECHHLVYCTCKSLHQVFRELDGAELIPYEEGIPELFGSFMDRYMGFS